MLARSSPPAPDPGTRRVLAVAAAVTVLSALAAWFFVSANLQSARLTGPAAQSPPPSAALVAPPQPPTVVAPAAPPVTATAPSPLEEWRAALPGLGIQPPVLLLQVQGDAARSRLVLTFNHAFHSQLQDLTALDALTGRLSEHAREAGYRHLELQLQERSGRIVPVDELVQTPPARRPRPEPIDDGVRR